MTRQSLTTVLAVLIVLSAVAFAQPRVEEFLLQTDVMLDEAAGRFEDAPEGAVALYEAAIDLQENAWVLFRDGNERGAHSQSTAARNALHRAISLLDREPDSDPDIRRIEALIARNRSTIDALEPLVEDSGRDDLIDMLENAQNFNDQAQIALDDEDYRLAFRLANNASDILARIRRALTSTHPGDHERILALIARNQDAIDELTPLVDESGRDDLIEMIGSAQDLNDEAQTAYDDEDYPLAQRLATTVSDMLTRIRRALASETPVDPSRILAYLEGTDDIIDAVAERFGDDAPEPILDAIEHARSLQSDAWDAYEEEDYRRALQFSQRARQLIERISRASRDADPRRVLAKLDATDALIERVTPTVEDSGNEDAIALLNDAIATQADARDAFEAEDYEEAMRLTLLARNMATRAASMIGSVIDRSEVLEALEATDTYIAEVTPAIEDSENVEAIRMLGAAVSMQAEAWDDYEAENFRGAMEKTIHARNMARRAFAMAGGSRSDG